MIKLNIITIKVNKLIVDGNMGKYRKKPIVVEAVQWFKVGDHSAVEQWNNMDMRVCNQCSYMMHSHGFCTTLECDMLVCVGDWIITEPDGKSHYPCKPDIFAARYEPADAVSTTGEPK